MRRGKKVISENVPVQFGKRIVGQPPDSLTYAFFLIQDMPVHDKRILRLFLRMINTAAHVREFEAPVIMFVVTIHATQCFKGRNTIEVHALYTHDTQRRGIVKFIRGTRLEHAPVGLDRFFVPLQCFVHLAEQKSPFSLEIVAAHIQQTRFEFSSRFFEGPLFNEKFAESKAQTRRRSPRRIFPVQAARKVFLRRFVGSRRHQCPGQPDPGLVFKTGLEGNYFTEFLLGPHIIFLIEIGFPDKHERIVHPFGARMVPQHIGALLYHILEIDITTRSGRPAEDAKILRPVYGLFGGLHGVNAILIGLPCVIERIVIGGEIVVPLPNEGITPAAGYSEKQDRRKQIGAGANGWRHKAAVECAAQEREKT